MRLPSHPRARVSRHASCCSRCSRRAVPRGADARSERRRGPSAKADRGVFVSKGVGRQIFTGGGGVAYGVVFSGASLVVADYSATHDMRVDSPVLPHHERRRLAHVRAGRRHQERRLPHLGHALPRDCDRARARSTPPASTAGCRFAARARSASTARARAGPAPRAPWARCRGTSRSSSSWRPPGCRCRRRPPPPPDPPPPPATTTTSGS